MRACSTVGMPREGTSTPYAPKDVAPRACDHSPGEYAVHADTVMVSLSKALGCPVGSVLAGEGGLMEESWRVRRRLGGAMRQSGLLAAAGLHALSHHRASIPEDHARARRLAAGIAKISGFSVVEPETNVGPLWPPAPTDSVVTTPGFDASRKVPSPSKT